ncbi:MAG: hypothetical protein IPL67_08710 [Ignavibacteria bacterium]|nr:hypothetical protein [Ignavibacteria bacterium]
MKINTLLRSLLSIALLFVVINSSRAQSGYNWIVPNKAYLKLSVIEDALYRITKTDFTNAGVNTSTVDPRTVKVFNKGVQIPIYFEGETDGVFDNADYFDFFGTRTYGGNTKFFNQDNGLVYTKDEYYSPYSDTNVYWVEWGISNGIRYANASYTSAVPYSPDFYYDKLHFEKDRVYTQGERTDANDFRNFNNENFLGEGWYWTTMTANQFVTDTFSVKTLTPSVQNASIKLFTYPVNRTTSINNEHSIQVQVNSTFLPQVFTNDLKKIDTTQTFLSSALSSTSVNTIRVYYFSNAAFNGSMYFDMFEVQGPKSFKFNANTISANLNNADTSSKRFRISGFVSGNQTNIYDVVNNIRITNYTSNADTLIVTAKSNARLEIVNKAITKKPFKITQRQVPNLASTSNGADYMIVYNAMFSEQAIQLQNHRETYDNFRVFTAEIRDIYDIFNYGIENPIALRNFLKYAYDSWTLPKLNYACLIGRGSTDPKKNSTASIYYQNLVPTYGNPTTDAYFANFNYGSYFYYPKILIGRLPAYNVGDASNMVENIISYETTPPETWWKFNTFIVGGGTSSDQNTFQSLDTAIINNYVLPPPLSSEVHKIFRNDTSTTVTFNYKDSIRRDINNGTAIVNFLGHAGYENWEDGMQDPSTLANYGKFPFIMSMTCYTGKNADPTQRTFGERYVNMLNRGTVGFIGCSGWGWLISQSNMQAGMYDAIANDTLRRFGEILNRGKFELIQDSTQSTVRHTVNSYGLLGDPAVKLCIPRVPEYSISSADYKLSNTFPEINQPLTLTIYPKNFGLFSDSCKIRFTLKKNSATVSIKDTVLRPFNMQDSVRFSFKPDSLADYSIQVLLDQDNRIPNELKSNNYLTVFIPLKEVSFVPREHVNNSVLNSDSVEFAGLNPLTENVQQTAKVIVEMDTTLMFNSAVKKTFVKNNATGAVTKFKTKVPVVIPGTIYFWRTNAVVNFDSAGWTTPLVFSYNPVLYTSENALRKSNEVLADAPDTGRVIFHKTDEIQFSAVDYNNTGFTSNGILLNQFPLNLYVRSMGSSGAEASFFSVNYQNINIDGGRSPGLSMLKVKKLNGTILEYKNIRTTSGQSSDSVINFLNTFDTTHYLMALNASYVASAVALNAAAKAKIRTFGSTKIDSFTVFGWFDSWSFIGYLGAPPLGVSEMFRKYSGSAGWVESNSSKSSVITKTFGTLTNYFGPAQNWKEFSWEQTLFPQSSLMFDVIGIDRNGVSSMIFSNVSSNQFVDISSIDAYQFPNMNLQAKFSIDTNTGFQSSLFNSLKVKYTPPAEIVVDKNTVVRSDTSFKPGDEMKVTISYSNAGFVNLPGTVVKVYKTSISTQNLVSTDTVYRALKIDSTVSSTHKFKIPYVKPVGGKAKFYIEIIPKGNYNESYTYNNSASFSVSLNVNTSSQMVDVFSDGQIVRSGDYVRANPELRIDLKDLAPDRPLLFDTSQVSISLNDLVVPYFGKGDKNLKASEDKVDIDGQPGTGRSLFYNPSLLKGENKLKIVYRNEAGEENSSEYVLLVSDEMFVKDFYNFPNPMRTETSFIFDLTGADSPRRRIYTTAGRLIKEISHTANVGFNQVLWDGRDEDGDFIANGVYLYKLVTEDDTKKETATQKLVVLR